MKNQTEKNYSCIVVDDDQIAIDLISEYIDNLEPLKLTKSYTDPLHAVREISQKSEMIDFLFLDIEMRGISGLDVGRLLRDKVRFLIFTTAFGHFALKAFEANCDQFLAKPFNVSKFSTVINRLISPRSPGLSY